MVLLFSVANVSASLDEKTSVPLGAPIDREQYRFSRRIPDAPRGPAVLLLDQHALARSNRRDVRIANGDGRQVPYLLETRAESLALKLAVPERRSEGTTSVYRFELPYNNLPLQALVLTTSARVFEREVQVRRAGRNQRRRAGEIIASTQWRSVESGGVQRSLRLDLPHRAPRAIEVVIDEGDNAPLPLASAKILMPLRALRFEHPGTPLFLLYGNRKATAPRYDLTLLEPHLSRAPARELTLPPLRAASDADDDGEGKRLFWIGIVIAGVVLIAMLLRLVLIRPETSRAPHDTT